MSQEFSHSTPSAQYARRALRERRRASTLSTMGIWRDHRSAVAAVLRTKGKTTYWLAQRLAGRMAATTLYDYLRGRRGISMDNMQRINDVLGLRFTDD